MTTHKADARPLQVLVADDHPTNRAVLEIVLSLIEAKVCLVEDGAQALEAFKAGEFDVVLMDLQMPVMDGWEAIRQMRGFEAQTGRRRTPILAVSANAMAQDVIDSRAAGADQHVAKPVVPDLLLQSIADRVEEAARLPSPAARSQASS